eukprot:15528-Heterococcus_DN1.PRE.8
MHYAVCCALHCVIHMVQAGTVTSHMHSSRDRAYAPLSHRALVVCCLSLPSTLRCVSFRKPNETAASNQAYLAYASCEYEQRVRAHGCNLVRVLS